MNGPADSSRRTVQPAHMGVKRRHFLGAVGAFTMGSSLRAASPPEALVGTQLYGWGQYWEREGKDIGTELDRVLGLIRDCGYDYAESSLAVDRPEENAVFAAKLKSRGLRAVSLYTGGRFHEADHWEARVRQTVQAAKSAREAGFRILVCNPDPVGREKTAEELKVQARALALLGKELKSLGMQLGIHHHTPEMASRAREFHSNFQQTQSGEVDFCYDVHWVYRGGVAPDEALRLYGDRVVSWHLRQSRAKIWWEDLDEGDIDYAAIGRTVRERQLVRNFTVELALEKGTQVTRTVVENHRRSRDFVRRILGA